eukprot:216360-Chlamydomonas_euryale.AAC.1
MDVDVRRRRYTSRVGWLCPHRGSLRVRVLEAGFEGQSTGKGLKVSLRSGFEGQSESQGLKVSLRSGLRQLQNAQSTEAFASRTKQAVQESPCFTLKARNQRKALLHTRSKQFRKACKVCTEEGGSGTRCRMEGGIEDVGVADYQGLGSQGQGRRG